MNEPLTRLTSLQFDCRYVCMRFCVFLICKFIIVVTVANIILFDVFELYFKDIAVIIQLSCSGVAV